MFWPDIFLSLRKAKSPVCHCQPCEGRRGNLIHPKERHVNSGPHKQNLDDAKFGYVPAVTRSGLFSQFHF